MNFKRFAKKVVILVLQCILAVEVLICIGALPVLLKDLSFHFSEYFIAIKAMNLGLISYDQLTLDGKNPLFPVIFDRYIESMKILGLSILTACFIAFIITYLSFIFFRKKINFLKNLIELAEAVPDLMFILLLQLAVIMIYKKTGIKIATVVSLREKAVLLPVISLSVPISFYITKVFIHHIEEELEKQYIHLAKAKGLSFSYILNIHVLRNIAEGMFGASKTIFWTMLSTLLVVDYLFNMNGLLRAMVTGPDPFVVGCILIFIPFYLLYRTYEWISFDYRKDSK
ncbi:ABC transporter permease subunit [Neobacillus sp. SAB-20_R2A]|uniref:ABC transporter permease subunit n=1 Tax=Neobacillus sp. SAB-20_R2A TaxID=3120519 RepID=UPI003C6DF484